MAYRADIEIGVKGADKLRELQERVIKLSRAVEDANVKTLIDRSAVQSVSEYTSVVAKAADTLRETAVQLNSAGKASGDYADAISQYVTALGQSNTLQKLQNDLIADEIELRRKQKLAQSGIRETTQYAGPIGPGPASAVDTLAGQTSPVAERVQRTLQNRREEAALQAALLRLEEKSASVLNEKVQAQQNLVQGTREVLELLQQQEQKTRFLTGTSGAVQGPLAPLVDPRATGFPIALPLTKAEEAAAELAAKKQTILERTVKTTQELSGLAANLQRIELNSVVAIEDANRAKEKAVTLAEKELAISKQGALVAGKFSPVGGAVNIPGSPAALAATAARRKEALSNAVIGGAFPLLFGQGAGAALGGGLGGAAGGLAGGQFGFGLSLVGTAIGQTFDNASQSAKDFADALTDTGDASAALETALGKLDKQTKTQISNLAKSGQQAAAAEASFDALAQKIGIEQAEAFQRAGVATSEWGSNLQTWLTKTYANVVLLGEEFNRTIFKLPGLQPPTSVFDIVEAAPQQRLSQEAQDRIEDLAGQNALLEKQVSLSRLTTDASIDQRLQLERQVALQDYVNSSVELERQLKQQLISDQEYNLRLKNVELNLTKNLLDLEKAAQDDRNRRAAEARQKAEQAARKQEQTIKSILGLQVELSQITLESADIDVSRTAATQGQLAGLKENLSQQQARLNVEARILDLQLDQKLASADISAQEKALLTSIYNQQRANLEVQAQTKARLLQLDIARLETARAIAALEGPRQLQDITQQRENQLNRNQAQLTSPLGGDAQERLNQQLDQYTRRYETLVPLERQLSDLQTERVTIASSASEEELGLLDTRIAATVNAIQLEQQYLSQLELSEQALLRQQQFVTRYGQLIQGVSSDVAGLVTTNLSEIVNGTKTTEQVFAEFLNSVGSALLDAAKQIIASYIAIGVAKLFAFGSSGGSGFGFSGAGPVSGASVFGGGQAGFNPAAFTGGFGFRAGGGAVSSQQPYIVGERGPELFVPGTGGSVVPTNDLRAAMGAAPGSSGGSPVLNMSFESTNIGGVEYVSRDQLEQAMAATRRQAAKDGAKRGMSMTLDRLQQSPQTRRRVGI